MPKDKGDPQLAELQMIRKLLVLALLRSGLTQSQLGGVLGLSQSQVSTMFPAGALAALSGKTKKAKTRPLAWRPAMVDLDAAKELRDLKMLMVLQLLKSGVTQAQIAAALGLAKLR